MAPKPIREISLDIKGRQWKFILLSDKTFDKLHNEDGGSRPGVTMPNQYTSHFRKSDWSLEDIIHELGHIHKHMTDTHTVDMTTDQMEEHMCQIIGKNYFQIGLVASLVAECFFGRE